MTEEGRAKRRKIFRIAVAAVFLLAMAAVTVWGIMWMMRLRDPDVQMAFQQRIASMGIWGWCVLFAIQYIQIVIAFIPGGPIQIIAGALFGPWGGMLTCLLGTVAATMTVFGLVSRYGKRVLYLFVDEKDIMSYRFLHDTGKLEALVLLLFFIPGTPKDALTYLFALTPIALPRFMILSTVARVPAMLTSVLAGDSVANGHWVRALCLFAGISLIAVGGYFLHKKVIEPRMHREKPDSHS